MDVLIASRNHHKIDEIRAVFRLPVLTLVAADEIPGLPEVNEDGQTFEDNAVKKAVTLALVSKRWTLADDSGLEVEALNGEPGVYSARYAGVPSNDKANNDKLLQALQETKNRRARFVCALALSSPSGRVQFVQGICAGTLLEEPRGIYGFGYDPLFLPEGQSQTFAELPAALKNTISHRAKALAQARERWGQCLSQEPDEWPTRRLTW